MRRLGALKLQNANLRFAVASQLFYYRNVAKHPQISNLHFAICNFKAPSAPELFLRLV